MKFGFLGTTEFATVILQDLLDKNRRPLWVITKPDSIAGRGQKLRSSPVKQLALEHQIPIYQPSKIDKNFLDDFSRNSPHGSPQLILVVAYGLILPTEFLQLPSHDCINIHTSLLPRWRGAAPIERSIQAGDKEVGISLIEITKELDAGPIIMQKKFNLSMGDTAADIIPKLNQLSRDALNEYFNNPDAWQKQKQKEEEAIYAEKITKEEAQIDWSQDAFSIARTINAFNPYPGAYSWLGGKRIKLLKALPITNLDIGGEESSKTNQVGRIIYTMKSQLRVICGEGEVEILMLQFPGRSPINPLQIQGKSPLDTNEQFTNQTS